MAQSVNFCGGANGGSQTIAVGSPIQYVTNFAAEYTNGASCFVQLSPPGQGFALTFSFVDFDTESNFDFFSIGSGATRVVPPSSGAVAPLGTLSAPPGFSMNLQFTSDNVVTRTGVTVLVSAIQSSTSGTFACSSRFTCGSCQVLGSGCAWCPSRGTCEFTGAPSSSAFANSFPIGNTCPGGANTNTCSGGSGGGGGGGSGLTCSGITGATGVTSCIPGNNLQLSSSTAGAFVGVVVLALLAVAPLLAFVYSAPLSAKVIGSVWAAMQAAPKAAPRSNSAHKLLIAAAALGNLTWMLLIIATALPWFAISDNSSDAFGFTSTIWVAPFLFAQVICDTGSCITLVQNNAVGSSVSYTTFRASGAFFLVTAAFVIAAACTAAVAARAAYVFAQNGTKPAASCCLNVQASVACAWTALSVCIVATSAALGSLGNTQNFLGQAATIQRPGEAAAFVACALLIIQSVLTTVAACRLRDAPTFKSATCTDCGQDCCLDGASSGAHVEATGAPRSTASSNPLNGLQQQWAVPAPAYAGQAPLPPPAAYPMQVPAYPGQAPPLPPGYVASASVPDWAAPQASHGVN